MYCSTYICTIFTLCVGLQLPSRVHGCCMLLVQKNCAVLYSGYSTRYKLSYKQKLLPFRVWDGTAMNHRQLTKPPDHHRNENNAAVLCRGDDKQCTEVQRECERGRRPAVAVHDVVQGEKKIAARLCGGRAADRIASYSRHAGQRLFSTTAGTTRVLSGRGRHCSTRTHARMLHTSSCLLTPSLSLSRCLLLLQIMMMILRQLPEEPPDRLSTRRLS